MKELIIHTNEKRQMVDITADIEEILSDYKGDGVCHIFVAHTTAALSTADLDPGGTAGDYIHVFNELIKEPEGGFRHPHDPSHMPDHILSTLIGTTLTIPIKDSQLSVGTWQRVVLIELDGPRDRKVIISLT